MTGPATTAPRSTGPTPAQVTQVRAFNRFYTNVIGVLHDMYLDTPYTLTESRLLYEIAKHGTVEVSWLRQALDIDAGYLSRVLSRFESEGLVTRHRSTADARRQEIRATDAGRGAVAELDERAAVQVGARLGGVGITPEGTTGQYRRDGVVFRPLRDAPPIAVHLFWRRHDPHPATFAAVALLTELYQANRGARDGTAPAREPARGGGRGRPGEAGTRSG